MDRQQNSSFQKIPTDTEMQQISATIDKLVKVKAKVEVLTPGDD